MFTRCPQCGTVFRITATQLRIAAGDVRCGSCARVFNALGQLTDEPPAFPEPARDGTPGKEPTGAQDAGQAVDEDTAMEFDAPEPTWSAYFLDAKAGPAADERLGKPPADVPLDGELEAITADPHEWRAFLQEMETAEDGATPWGSEEIDLGGEEPGQDDAPVYFVDETPDGPADPRKQEAARHAGESAAQQGDGGPQVPPSADAADEWPADGTVESPEEAPAEPFVLGAFMEDSASQEDAERAALAPWSYAGIESAGEVDRPRSGWWAVGSLILLALLGAQYLHAARDDLAIHPVYGATLRDLYARLGSELLPSWPLDAYAVRRAEALAGGSAANALDISAVIETQGKAPLGLPLVRVALRDQWANVVASRVFTPSQYLPEALPPIVPGGTRIPVRLSVADPGTQARGFEVDLCLPRRQGLDCQRARDPFQQ